ncbi:hypothetical protein AJ79_03415 [Helicocarpus griseus UAMH5409]|uniref:DUF7053 domain-containing protein n=1 Tax=Helicocarpus griseus UAMH5409 TaxID=1447875 RepID=A0A2B7XZE8_9EURO|nr:hypothetical protein AJ79_03415 [Helicocarpus griseus UAMH5409]
MFKRSIFTTVTPLPSHIPRDIAVETLHAHSEMIELNPLVIKHERCKPPPNAPPDEFHCIWYELTDKIHYLPGGILRGRITYKACFHDLPRGLQTHVYAPTGLDIRNRWTIGGNMPGEPREPVELGLTDAPREGLYLREDVDMRCNIFANSFVKKTLKEAHAVLVARLLIKADLLKGKTEETIYERAYPAISQHRHSLSPSQGGSCNVSYMSTLSLPHSPAPLTPGGGMLGDLPSPSIPHGSQANSNLHPCCAHGLHPPHQPGYPFGQSQNLPVKPTVEIDSTECQPARVKAYAAARGAQIRSASTPPQPKIYELE